MPCSTKSRRYASPSCGCVQPSTSTGCCGEFGCTAETRTDQRDRLLGEALRRGTSPCDSYSPGGTPCVSTVSQTPATFSGGTVMFARRIRKNGVHAWRSPPYGTKASARQVTACGKSAGLARRAGRLHVQRERRVRQIAQSHLHRAVGVARHQQFVLGVVLAVPCHRLVGPAVAGGDWVRPDLLRKRPIGVVA